MPLSKDPRICWETDIFFEQPVWCTEPGVQNIKTVVLPYLQASGFTNPTVTFFAEGAFNKLYTIHAVDPDFGVEQSFIFRVALPVHPYYKTESEVATCNYIRLYTSIPAPRIYAWDSSSKNALGFEWMLMEKMPGTPLAQVWGSLGWERKVCVARQVAEWMDELSRRRFTQVGSLYHSSKWILGGFEVGQAVNFDLYRGRCLQYKLDRGPFSSAEQFYRATISARRKDVDFYAETVQEEKEGLAEEKSPEDAKMSDKAEEEPLEEEKKSDKAEEESLNKEKKSEKAEEEEEEAVKEEKK